MRLIRGDCGIKPVPGVAAPYKTATILADPLWGVTPATEAAKPPSTTRPERISSAGAWAFRNRSWLPVPLGIALLALSWRGATPSVPLAILGLCVLAAGQAIRFWAVRHIGPISRTRACRVGPLITSGPYALTRNPLYIGNWCLWTGVVMIAGIAWMLPIVWLAFGLQYGGIVAWEERLITRRLTRYGEYATHVPRWWPRRNWHHASLPTTAGVFTWREVLHSERGTLLALVAALLLFLHPLVR
jgi:protein-S-isoprenylcysteine O-methyltransferase Ste14